MTGWTEQRPTAPGWYWWRGKKQEPNVFATLPVRVDVGTINQESVLMALEHGSVQWGQLSTFAPGVWQALLEPTAALRTALAQQSPPLGQAQAREQWPTGYRYSPE